MRIFAEHLPAVCFYLRLFWFLSWKWGKGPFFTHEGMDIPESQRVGGEAPVVPRCIRPNPKLTNDPCVFTQLNKTVTKWDWGVFIARNGPYETKIPQPTLAPIRADNVWSACLSARNPFDNYKADKHPPLSHLTVTAVNCGSLHFLQ